jgi:hypothetical protein
MRVETRSLMNLPSSVSCAFAWAMVYFISSVADM